MGKKESLIAGMGDRIRESASHRAPAVAMPGVGSSVVAESARHEGVVRSKVAQIIPTKRIVRDPEQPREEFNADALARLADSMRANGVLQPIAVRWDEGQGAYVVVVGERRWRAARIAGLESMPCTVIDRNFGPGELLGVQVMENVLREDLKPIEQAKAYRTLMEVHGWSGNRLSKELGISQATVSQALSTLRLPETVQDVVESGALPVSAAYAIASKIADPVAQEEVAAKVVAEKLDRRQVAAVVDQVAQQEVAAGRYGTRQGRASAGRPKAVRVALPVPVVYETAEFTITVKFKTANPRPVTRIAGDFVRWLKSRNEGPDAKAEQGAAGQGAESDAA